MPFSGLAGRIAQVRETIADRQRKAGWTHRVRIVAVTKAQGIEAVRAAHEAGLDAVGENRVQEARAKQQEAPPGLLVEWHLIGSLQRNKARHAAGHFALIHSIDSAELAGELDRRSPGGVQDVLVQVNCSKEPQKGGIEPAEVGRLLDTLASLPRVRTRGLMTMAAFTADEAEQRRTFALLRELRDAAVRSGHDLPELSMGMSGDYGPAAEEGATMLRLGTVLFGERELEQLD